MTAPETARQTKACPFCAEQILPEARKCKHCGEMLEGKPVVIEKTSKALKRQILNGVQIAVFGIILVFFGASAPEMRVFSTVGVWVTLIGVVWYGYAKYKSWWHHG